MFKSSEGSGRLMIVKLKTILGNCLELENEQDNQNNDILPDVERNDICVLLSISSEKDIFFVPSNPKYEKYFTVYIPRLQKIGWLLEDEVEFVDH